MQDEHCSKRLSQNLPGGQWHRLSAVLVQFALRTFPLPHPFLQDLHKLSLFCLLVKEFPGQGSHCVGFNDPSHSFFMKDPAGQYSQQTLLIEDLNKFGGQLHTAMLTHCKDKENNNNNI